MSTMKDRKLCSALGHRYSTRNGYELGDALGHRYSTRNKYELSDSSLVAVPVIHADNIESMRVACTQCGTVWFSVPSEFYLSESTANAVIADALAEGRYEDAIALYVSAHWTRVKEVMAYAEKE